MELELEFELVLLELEFEDWGGADEVFRDGEYLLVGLVCEPGIAEIPVVDG